MHRLLLLCLATLLPASVSAADHLRPPLAHHGGEWPTGHVQGIAVDTQGGFIYYSFTSLVAKYDFDGKLIGTIENIPGHTGDMDFNPDDGCLYASFEYYADQAYYITRIDGRKIDRVGINLNDTDIFHTVYIEEVTKDYLVDLNRDGIITLDYGKNRNQEAKSPDHRYGVAGIDGVGIGPQFGRTHGPRFLTVAYGNYNNLERTDLDHQVLLQYDIKDFSKYARPFRPDAPHRSGPLPPHGKYSSAPARQPGACRIFLTMKASSAGSSASTRARRRSFPTICSSRSRPARSPSWAISSASPDRRAKAGSKACCSHSPKMA